VEKSIFRLNMSFNELVPDWTLLEWIFKSIFALVCLTIARNLRRNNEQKAVNLDKMDLENVMKCCAPDVISFKCKVKMLGDNVEERESGESKSSKEFSLPSKRDPVEELIVVEKEQPEINTKEEPSIRERELQGVEPERKQVEESLFGDQAKIGIQKQLYRQKNRIPWYQKVIQELKAKTLKTGSKLTIFLSVENKIPNEKD